MKQLRLLILVTLVACEPLQADPIQVPTGILFKAAGDKSTQELDLAYTTGSNLTVYDEQGNTLLHAACGGSSDKSQGKACRFMIQATRDLLGTKNNEGDTPLHKAAADGNLDGAQALVEAGADKGITNKDGKTAYELAKENGHEDVRALLKSNRDLYISLTAAGIGTILLTMACLKQ